jgi:hypothetical protein
MLCLWPSYGVLHFKSHPFTRNQGLVAGHFDGRTFNTHHLAIVLHDVTKTFIFTIAVYDSLWQNTVLVSIAFIVPEPNLQLLEKDRLGGDTTVR